MANTLKFGNGEWYGKKDTILAYNDENSNYKPLPFDFSRASKATVVNKDGLIEEVGSGQPRIDYKDDSKGALLLEPQRTNIVEYSEDGTQWGTINSTVSLTTDSTSPSSQSSVYKVNDDAVDAQHRVDVKPAVTSGTEYTFSVFVKKPSDSDVDFVYLLFSSNFSTTRLYFNIEEGTSLDSGGIIENYGNGWYKISGTATANSSGNGVFGVNLTNADNNNTYSGTGNGSMYVWGIQVESNASYPTSYIPTSGSAVTRIADACNNGANEQVIGQTEGVAYVEIDWKGNDEESIFSVLHDGTVNNRMDFGYSAAFNSFYFNVRTNGSSQGLMQYSSPIAGKYKIAIAYKNNGFALWVNGVKEASDGSGSVPITTKYNVGNYIGGGREYPIISSKLYNTKLTDQELQALTQV